MISISRKILVLFSLRWLYRKINENWSVENEDISSSLSACEKLHMGYRLVRHSPDHPLLVEVTGSLESVTSWFVDTVAPLNFDRICEKNAAAISSHVLR